jgi:hypothetical protein
MMVARPNFTDVQLAGDTVRVFGTSDPDDPDDILDIRVILAQEGRAGGESARIAGGSVVQLGSAWRAEVPSEGFAPGPAVAFGVETRRKNVTTITWAEPVEIR